MYITLASHRPILHAWPVTARRNDSWFIMAMVRGPKTMTKRNPHHILKALVMLQSVKLIKTMTWSLFFIQEKNLQYTTNKSLWIDYYKNRYKIIVFYDMVTFVFCWDNLFGFSRHKIKVTTKQSPILDMYDSMSLSHPFLDMLTITSIWGDIV